MRRSFKRKGFVKSYKKAAFMGRKTPRWSKMFSSIMNKCLTNWSINQTLTNVNTAGTDNAWVLMPLAGLIQTGQAQTAAAAANAVIQQEQFSGIEIWLRGIQLELLIVSEASQDFYLRIMGFWATPDVNMLNQLSAGGNAWTTFVNTGVAGNTVGGSKLGEGALGGFHFLDLPYAPASNYGNFSNITTRPNPNYPGKLLFDYKKKLTCTATIATAGGNPSMRFSKYFPFNKIYQFATYPFQAQQFDTILPNLESLDVAPNFGKHGQFVLVVYYANTIDIPAAGTEASIGLAGTVRTYFKDVGV